MPQPLAPNFPPESAELEVPEGCRLQGLFEGAATLDVKSLPEWREIGFKEATLCWPNGCGPVDRQTFIFVCHAENREHEANRFAEMLRRRGFIRVATAHDDDAGI